MAEIRFQSREETLELLNPLKGFQRDSQRLQVRKDPLLGHTSIYNPLIEQGLKIFVGDPDRDLLERLRTESAPKCFFCPEKLAGTARFTEDFLAEGRIEVGDTVLFPNLFSLGKHHAVAVVSKSHFLELEDFTTELLTDAFQAVQKYVIAVYQHDASANYVSVNANYLFPAGASLMHPHFQPMVTAEPYTHQARLLEACRHYLSSHGRAFHEDLIETERNLGERYIAQTGAWHWMAAYSPMVSNEIIGVHEEHGELSELHASDIEGLAQGLSAILQTFGHLGYLSFNFSLYARRAPAASDGFACLIRCMTRQNPSAAYRTDDFFLQKGLQSEIILKLPEELAAQARPFFR